MAQIVQVQVGFKLGQTYVSTKKYVVVHEDAYISPNGLPTESVTLFDSREQASLAIIAFNQFRE